MKMKDVIFETLGAIAIVVGAVGLCTVLTSTSAQAQEITDDELCEKAVAYSVKYLPEEDGLKLHQARWQIIEGERTDDLQKLVGLVVFEIGQRIGYSYDVETHGEGTEWIEQQIEVMQEGCEKAIVQGRGNQYGEFESANPDEAW
jgi:hypothetical protein